MTSHSAHRRVAALGTAVLLAAVTLTACADSTAGSGSQAGAGGGATSGSSGASATSSSPAKPAGSVNELAASIATATAKGTTVHLTLSTAGGGAASDAGSGEGDVRTADGGKTDAFTFSIGSGSTAVTLVYVDGAGYVKLPASEQTDPSKPWAKVSDTSTNPVVKAISASFDKIDTQTSLTQYAALVKSASNFGATGAAEIDGTAVQGYSFDIDPKDLPNAADLGAAVSQLGPIPTTFAVDDQGRPVQVVEKISIAGQSITTTVSFSDYGKQVDISAPPAAETSTD